MRGSDRLGLAFVVLVVISATLTWTFVRHSDVVSRIYKKENRRSHYSYKGEKGSGYYAQQDIGYGDGSASASEDGLAARLFAFDPNTADSSTLLRLGLKPWQVRSIYKYRAHGGHFRKPQDFARLYGLTLAQYRRLEPYISIKSEVMAADVIGEGSTFKPADSHVPTSTATPSRQQYPPKLTMDDAKVDINTADTTLLKRIPGIGSYFARRIVELRQHRQAFVATDELLVIRNFPETALPYMTASHNFPLLHINSMTLKELQAHPLLNYTQARDIVALRRTSGSIRSVQDMAFLKSFNKEMLARLSPFLLFD